MVKHVTHIKKTKQMNALEKLVLVVAIVEPLSTIPQIMTLFSHKDATSISLLSWALFMGASLLWLFYGIKIRSIPLIASSILWVSAEVIMIIGIIMYS